MKSTRLRSSRFALLPIILLVAALIFWPTVDSMQRQSASAQGVSWLGPDSTSYLTSSSGIPVWVPSWLPGPVAGTSPEVYAVSGNYSIYFYGAGGTFLYITGVAGAGFPGGSEANLNVELTVNASVAGYPAIHDIGIPEGSETPIYDKVMWIAGGVLYTINGNGLDSGSLALANSSVVLQPSAAPAPTDPPVVEQPPAETGGQNSGVTEPAPDTSTGQSTSNTGSEPTTNTSPSDTGSTTQPTQASNDPGITGVIDESVESPDSTGGGDDGTGGPWYTGNGVSDLPSDGTAGPIPPRLSPDDGTSGAP